MGKDKPVTDADITYIKHGTSFFDPRNKIGDANIPLDLFKSIDASCFVTKAQGNGMQGVGIDDGDMLLFSKTDHLDSGE